MGTVVCAQDEGSGDDKVEGRDEGSDGYRGDGEGKVRRRYT